jgi:hypothetical protein
MVLSTTIVPDIATLTIGQTQRFSVSVELGPGIPPSGPVPGWSSTSPAVVAVDFSGMLTEGKAIIEVLFRGKTATRRLQVVPQIVETRDDFKRSRQPVFERSTDN